MPLICFLLGWLYVFYFFGEKIGKRVWLFRIDNRCLHSILALPKVLILIFLIYFGIYAAFFGGLLVTVFGLIPGFYYNTRIYCKIMKYWSRRARRPSLTIEENDVSKVSEEIIVVEP